MSNLVFPLDLAGIDIALHRHPVTATSVQTASSGAELRASWQSYPRYKYSAQINAIRSAAALAEFQAVMSAFVGQLGQYDTFLIQDPEDCQVTDHGFAIADGSATAFQLQRTLGGSRRVGAWDAASYPISTVPRTNVLTYSEDLTNSAWTAESGVTVTGSIAAPDGSTDAQEIATTTAGNGVVQASGVAAADGAAWTVSIWLKAASATTATLLVDRGSGSDAESTTVNVTTAWQRFSFSHSTTWSGATDVRAAIRPATTTSVDAFGAQLEASAAATAYIATTSAAVTVTPAYWPSYGDGFEPVTEVNPGSLTVYENGSSVAATLQSGGSVLLGSAPASGHVLTWSGQYFRRVRFAADEFDFERVVSGIWAGKDTLDFISVK